VEKIGMVVWILTIFGFVVGCFIGFEASWIIDDIKSEHSRATMLNELKEIKK